MANKEAVFIHERDDIGDGGNGYEIEKRLQIEVGGAGFQECVA